MVWHNVMVTLILHSGSVVSPFDQSFQNRGLSHCTGSLVSLQNHVVIKILYDMLFPGLEADAITLVKCLLQKGKWIFCVDFKTFLDKFLSHVIINIEETVSIFSGVFEHLF